MLTHYSMLFKVIVRDLRAKQLVYYYTRTHYRVDMKIQSSSQVPVHEFGVSMRNNAANIPKQVASVS